MNTLESHTFDLSPSPLAHTCIQSKSSAAILLALTPPERWYLSNGSRWRRQVNVTCHSCTAHENDQLTTTDPASKSLTRVTPETTNFAGFQSIHGQKYQNRTDEHNHRSGANLPISHTFANLQTPEPTMGMCEDNTFTSGVETHMLVRQLVVLWDTEIQFT